MMRWPVLAALALAGCVPPGIDRGNEVAPANQAVAPRVPAPAQNTVPVSPLVGRWADSPAECANPVEIFSNGTVRASDGSRGHWRLEGDRLTFNLGNRSFAFTITSMARDRVFLIDANGERSESVRCR